MTSVSSKSPRCLRSCRSAAASWLRRDALGIRKEEDRASLSPELHTLLDRGKKSVSAAGLAAVRIGVAGNEDDESGEILISAPEPVGEPRAHAGAAEDLMAG